jgi:hypothetical protein
MQEDGFEKPDEGSFEDAIVSYIKGLRESKLELNISLPPGEEEMLQHHLSGPKYHHAFYEIQQEIFRPARKHGYNDRDLNMLLEMAGKDEEGYSIGESIIGKLEEMFLEYLSEKDISIF